MRMSLLALLGGLAVGIAVGWVLGSASSPQSEAKALVRPSADDLPPGQDEAAVSLAGAPKSLPPEGVETGGAEAARSAGTGPDTTVLTYEAFARDYRASYAKQTGGLVPSNEQVRAAWNHHRGAALGAGLAAGGHAGIAEAKKRTVATIQARDDILTLVTDRDRRDEARAAARDPIVFERLFAHRGEGPSLDGKEAVEAHAKTPVPDGALLAFGPGVHEVDWRTLGRTSFPKDLTIRGAGIDRTLLTLSDLSTNSVVFNLHLEDLTIDCGNDGAFDLRSKGAAIRTERVRFVRFDAAHGGAYVFDVTQAGAVHCIDCEFVCGYGRAPGCGNVLRSIVAARFDDCLFDNFVYDLARAGVFSGCTFRDCRGMEKRLERALAVPATSGSHYFEGCRVLWTLPEEQRETWESKLRLRDWKAFQQAFQR